MKSKAIVGILGWVLALTLCGCGGMSEKLLESDEIYGNQNNETSMAQSEEKDNSMEDRDDTLSIGMEQSLIESSDEQNDFEESTGTDGTILDAGSDEFIFQELMYGTIGKRLGLGTLVYAISQNAEEDYKVYFFASQSEEERYLSLEEKNFELSNVTYVFPDVREGNIPIGKFQELYYFGLEDIGNDGIMDILLIASYEVEDQIYYDTRVYTECEEGYVFDDILTKELNKKYYNIGEYPVEDVLELPHD